MKICISASGRKEQSLLNSRFGRCPYFLIFNSQTGKWEAKENQSIAAFRGAGVSAAQKVLDWGCKAVITGNMGPNAFRVMEAAGIKVYLGDIGKSVAENLKMYREGKLSELAVPGRAGMGIGWGRRWRKQ